MKRIESVSEVHEILLKITEKFISICAEHRIPYVMLGGTMLGAVRHNGFIPWDDDMDFGVPRKYYSLLIEHLENELPSDYRCLTYKNCEQIKYPFIKIEDSRTVIDDPRVDSVLDKKIGVNIDIFPLDCCRPNGIRTKIVLLLVKLQTVLFVETTSLSHINKFFRQLLRFLIPISKNRLLVMIDILLENSKDKHSIGNVLGRWKTKEIFPNVIYQLTSDYNFERIKLEGVKDYQFYLSQLYGNYMELPPENQRVAHVQNVFYRCKL